MRTSTLISSLLLALLLALVPPLPAMPAAVGAARSCVTKVTPQYPQIARQIRIEGSVLLELTIEADGHVSAARVLEGHPMLTAAATQAAMQWRYTPASEPTLLCIRIDFKL